MGDTLYQKLKAVMQPSEIDNHYSDLYVLANIKARTIIAAHTPKPYSSIFRSNVDGQLWFDIPFAYDPYWEKRNVSVAAVAEVSEAVNRTQAMVKPPGKRQGKKPRLSR